MVSDRGVYACTATSHGGEAAAYAMIEVESKSSNKNNPIRFLFWTEL